MRRKETKLEDESVLRMRDLMGIYRICCLIILGEIPRDGYELCIFIRYVNEK